MISNFPIPGTASSAPIDLEQDVTESGSWKMAETVVRSSCRFVLKTSGRECRIEMELFHPTVPALAGATLGFEVLGGIGPE